jgi:hypothetical protein
MTQIQDIEHGKGCGCPPDPPLSEYYVTDSGLAEIRWERRCPASLTGLSAAPDVQQSAAKDVPIDE